MEALDTSVLLRLLPNELAPVDEEVEAIDSRKAGEEPANDYRQGTQLQGCRQHLEADRGQQNAAGEAERERHEQGRGPAPEREEASHRRGNGRAGGDGQDQEELRRHRLAL